MELCRRKHAGTDLGGSGFPGLRSSLKIRNAGSQTWHLSWGLAVWIAIRESFEKYLAAIRKAMQRSRFRKNITAGCEAKIKRQANMNQKAGAVLSAPISYYHSVESHIDLFSDLLSRHNQIFH